MTTILAHTNAMKERKPKCNQIFSQLFGKPHCSQWYCCAHDECVYGCQIHISYILSLLSAPPFFLQDIMPTWMCFCWRQGLDLCMINSRIPFKIAVKLNRQLFSCSRMTNRKCSAILKDKNQKTIYLVLT